MQKHKHYNIEALNIAKVSLNVDSIDMQCEIH